MFGATTFFRPNVRQKSLRFRFFLLTFVSAKHRKNQVTGKKKIPNDFHTQWMEWLLKRRRVQTIAAKPIKDGMKFMNFSRYARDFESMCVCVFGRSIRWD